MADDKGRIRTPVSPARWADDELDPQPGVVSLPPEPAKEPEPVKEPAPAKKK